MLVGICCFNIGQCTVAFLLVCKCKVGQFKKNKKKQKVVAGVGCHVKIKMYCLLIICNVMLFVDNYCCVPIYRPF